MTQKERLVELINRCPTNNMFMFEGDFNYRESLADHLLSNGVIVPPCKVGDRVWIAFNGDLYEEVVSEIQIDISGKPAYWARIMLFDDGDVGKRVFLSREEAEQALKERE